MPQSIVNIFEYQRIKFSGLHEVQCAFSVTETGLNVVYCILQMIDPTYENYTLSSHSRLLILLNIIKQILGKNRAKRVISIICTKWSVLPSYYPDYCTPVKKYLVIQNQLQLLFIPLKCKMGSFNHRYQSKCDLLCSP